MNKFVKFAGRVGAITDNTPHHNGTSVEVHYHNGLKVAHTYFEKRSLTEITPAEFEQAIREKGQTSMLKFLVTTASEEVVWHTDPRDTPHLHTLCLVQYKCSGSPGVGLLTWNGKRFQGENGCFFPEKLVTAWAYGPKGPKL